MGQFKLYATQGEFFGLYKVSQPVDHPEATRKIIFRINRISEGGRCPPIFRILPK